MNRATPKLCHFAERLIAYEAVENPSLGTNLPAACFASEKLRPHLAALLGNIGFSAILSRSLALGVAEFPWLSTVRVNANGTFEGFEELGVRVEVDEFSKGCAVLLAHLLGLLIAFIGEELTLRLVGAAWPEQTFYRHDLEEGGK